MDTSKPKRKRPASTTSPLTTSSLSLNEITTPYECYNFVSPNEYSDKTFGVLAFLLRKLVGDINFSDILDEAEKHHKQGRVADFIKLLENKRDSMKEIEASVEKCLMINRFISHIQEDETRFMTLLSNIRFDMKVKMTDNQINPTVQYPNDFRQREADFFKRKYAQDVRRLFYRSHSEVKEPPNLIHVKNRTTEHLNYLIDYKMRYEPTFRDTGLNEIFNILNTSFMIIAQPHHDVNPVLIYERKGPGIYTAKVSVTIVSLLYDFMQTHPNMIELYDIEPTLCPASDHYKLDEPHSIPWSACHLQACLDNKPQIIQYAELSSITIQQTHKNDKRVHFAQALHTLKLNIKFHLNFTEYRFSKTYQITLESLPFAIGQHNNQIPQLLTRVILDDIKRFSKLQVTDIKIILYFMLRYFMHRTGVEPTEDQKIYLEEELKQAMNARKNFQTLEDIYMDFLVPYVYQVEFMAKHPILAMFYTDRLFLGPCNSARAAEVMKKPSDVHLPKIDLRFNSIKVDYAAIASMSALNRTIKLNACAVRVDIYNDPRKGIQNLTFDSSILANDISKFVSTYSSEKASHISVLSNLDDKTNENIYKSYTEFSKYYHDRLHEISKTDEKYKFIDNIIDNIDDGDYEEISNDEEIQNTDSDNLYSFDSNSSTSISLTTFDNEQNVDTNNTHNDMPTSSNEVLSLSDQQIIQYVLSKPDLLTELMHQMNLLNLTVPKQQLSSHINPNQFQLCSINTTSQQTSTQIENIETSKTIVTQSSLDILELITIDPLAITDEDFQVLIDELTTDNLPS